MGGTGLALRGQEGLGKQAESLQAAIKKEPPRDPSDVCLTRGYKLSKK